MTLAHPWALALAALALPVIAAYLHKLHRDRRTIASVILARALRDERPASRRSRARLRHRLSLALVLAALVAGLVALVGPHASAGRAHRTILVLDRSASMGTEDRLARAVDAVRTVVDRAGDGDEVALVTVGGDPAIAVAPTRAHADVIAAAEAVSRAGAGGDNRDDARAFALADGLCRDAAHGSIVVVSDGAGLAIPPATRCPVRGIAIGRRAENLGITGLWVRALGLGAYDVHVAVASSANVDRHVEVTLTAGGQLVDVVTLEVPLHGDAERTVRVTAEGKTLSASLAGGDANPLDDHADVALADAGPVSVLVVTTRKLSLVAEALKLHPRVTLTVAEPGHLPGGAFDLIVLEDDPRAALPAAGHVVAFGASPGAGAPLQLADAASERKVTRWDFDAPWFRYVDLHDLLIAKAQLVRGGKPVVETGAGPVVASATWEGRELVVAGFALDATDLALRAAFPNLVANLVDWAGPAHATAAHGVLAASESHVDPEPLPAAGEATGGTPWRDAPWLARLAVLLAIALLVVEQLVYLRGGTRGPAIARRSAAKQGSSTPWPEGSPEGRTTP